MACAWSYELEQKRLLDIWNEIEKEDEIGGPTEDDVDVVEQSDHDSNSEQSDDESVDHEKDNCTVSDANAEEINAGGYFLGKDNKFKWYKHPIEQRSTKTKSRNIVTQAAGVVGLAKSARTVLDAWKLFFPDYVIAEIVECTNEYIRKLRENYSRERDAADTDICEIRAVIGLLYLAGTLHSSHQNLLDLWEQDGTGVEFFRLVMGINRFKFLLRAIRFDNVNNRDARTETDRLAKIRHVMDGFVERCKQHYSVSEFVTIDEMLESFRGRCAFRQYMPNKPAKYGLKIMALVDAQSYYTYNMEVYVGKQPDGPYKVDNGPTSVVQRLIQPISGTGRNVTCDNWFTSIPLAIDLLTNHKLTMVGTLRKNKGEIPPLFIAKMKERKINSSIFGFTKDMTLVSYKPKPNKIVLLLSTMHHKDEIDPSETNKSWKPSIITFYNHTKGGVDVVDELKSNYSVSRTSHRWPLTLFFSLLNIGGINSQIIYEANTNNKSSRRNFLKILAKDLVQEILLRRNEIQSLPRNLKLRIGEILQIPQQHVEAAANFTPGRCHLCSSKKNRKTSTQCKTCTKFICREHTIPSCTSCAGANLTT